MDLLSFFFSSLHDVVAAFWKSIDEKGAMENELYLVHFQLFLHGDTEFILSNTCLIKFYLGE